MVTSAHRRCSALERSTTPASRIICLFLRFTLLGVANFARETKLETPSVSLPHGKARRDQTFHLDDTIFDSIFFLDQILGVHRQRRPFKKTARPYLEFPQQRKAVGSKASVHHFPRNVGAVTERGGRHGPGPMEDVEFQVLEFRAGELRRDKVVTQDNPFVRKMLNSRQMDDEVLQFGEDNVVMLETSADQGEEKEILEAC